MRIEKHRNNHINLVAALIAKTHGCTYIQAYQSDEEGVICWHPLEDGHHYNVRFINNCIETRLVDSDSIYCSA